MTLRPRATSPTNLSPIPFTATFSEAVTGFDASDITVTTDRLELRRERHDLHIRRDADRRWRCDRVNRGERRDRCGSNGNSAATPLTLTSDTTPPTATSASTATDPTSTNPIPFTVTFSENRDRLHCRRRAVTTARSPTSPAPAPATPSMSVPSGNDVQVSVSVPAVRRRGRRRQRQPGLEHGLAPVHRRNGLRHPHDHRDRPDELSPDPDDRDLRRGRDWLRYQRHQRDQRTASNVQGSGSTYTFDVTPTADGPVVIDVVAGAATGTVSNNPTKPPSSRLLRTRLHPPRPSPQRPRTPPRIHRSPTQ